MLPRFLLKRLFVFMMILISLSSAGSFTSGETHAAKFDTTLLRLDRLASGTPISGLICVTPSSAGVGVENKITITFPSNFSINTNPANWITGTSSLPSGSTPWPGISATAQSVSGTSVTFTGNDLNSGTADYCFTFSSNGSTTGTEGHTSGTVSTLTAGNALLDSTEYGLTIGDDRIGVSATVPANPNDFTIEMTQNPPQTNVAQDTLLTYNLEYTSLLPNPTTMTLEADWSLGTIEGSGVPTLEIVGYEAGSAGNAYGNAPPVIDPVNRKITWTIPSFPANTTENVTFALRTTDTYTGTSPVTFSVQARIKGPGTTSSDSTVTNTYLFSGTNTVTGVPPEQQGPTATQSPPQTQPPQTTPIPQNPAFFLDEVSIRNVTQDTATVVVFLSNPGTIRISYGTNPAALTESVTALTPADFQSVILRGLKPDTRYYFRISATDLYGQSFISDLYTVRTAKPSIPVRFAPDTFIAISDKNLIFTFQDRQRLQGRNILVLPTNTPFGVQFSLATEANIKSAYLFTRDRQGRENLGSEWYPLLEIKPGVFTGRLTSGGATGMFSLFVRIEDYNGNITEQMLSEMKVSNPFMIMTDMKKPLEHAKVRLFIFNLKERIFQYLSPDLLPITNPAHSLPTGKVPWVLPMGTYRAEITAIGYTKKTVDFVIGPGTNENYPQVVMTAEPFSFLTLPLILWEAGSDILYSLAAVLGTFSTSPRIFDLVALTTIAGFGILTLLALSEKMQIKPGRLPVYFLSLLTLHQGKKEKLHVFRGVIADGFDKKPIPGVDIFVKDTGTGQIIFHTKSTAKGTLKIPLPSKSQYVILFEKVGYHAAECPLDILPADQEQQFTLLSHEELITKRKISEFFRISLSFSFELLLLLFFILALLMIPTFGMLTMLPFILLGLFNLVFWMLHTIHHHTGHQ